MGEDEANGADGRQVQLFGDRHEVMAIGTQAVQHDQAGDRVGAGLVFQGFKVHGRQHSAGCRRCCCCAGHPGGCRTWQEEGDPWRGVLRLWMLAPVAWLAAPAFSDLHQAKA